jgi:hypothetical protein
MVEPIDHKMMLDGINVNIHLTETQIDHLKRELAALAEDGASAERKVIFHRLAILEGNLQLLKSRRTYAIDPDMALEHPFAKQEDPYRGK